MKFVVREHLLDTINIFYPSVNISDLYYHINSMTSLKTVNPLLYESLRAAPTSDLVGALYQICATDKAVENAFASRYIILVDENQPNHKRKREDAESVSIEYYEEGSLDNLSPMQGKVRCAKQ